VERLVDEIEVEVGLKWDLEKRNRFGAELEWYVAGVAHLWCARRDMLCVGATH
jgi:hypothetical protein